MSAKFSAMVLPVMVRQSPWSSPSLSSIFITWGMPPTLCKSVATYLPEGLRSQNTGTLLRMRSKSSMVRSTPMVWAIASKCSTEFVDPPTAIITDIAFSKASLVRMSFGKICALIASTSANADFSVLSAFSSSSAAIVEDFGKLKPIASIAEDMVFAVNIPPQEPAPGQAFRSTASKRALSILPALY